MWRAPSLPILTLEFPNCVPVATNLTKGGDWKIWSKLGLTTCFYLQPKLDFQAGPKRRVSSEKRKSFRKTKISRKFQIFFRISFARKKCKNYRFFTKFCFILLSEKMRNFYEKKCRNLAKKFLKYERKCSHFLVKVLFAGNPSPK